MDKVNYRQLTEDLQINPSGRINDFMDSQKSWHLTLVFMKIGGGDNVDWVNVGFVGDSVIGWENVFASIKVASLHRASGQ